jgi:hypothetical protein
MSSSKIEDFTLFQNPASIRAKEVCTKNEHSNFKQDFNQSFCAETEMTVFDIDIICNV